MGFWKTILATFIGGIAATVVGGIILLNLGPIKEWIVNSIGLILYYFICFVIGIVIGLVIILIKKVSPKIRAWITNKIHNFISNIIGLDKKEFENYKTEISSIMQNYEKDIAQLKNEQKKLSEYYNNTSNLLHTYKKEQEERCEGRAKFLENKIKESVDKIDLDDLIEKRKQKQNSTKYEIQSKEKMPELSDKEREEWLANYGRQQQGKG